MELVIDAQVVKAYFDETVLEIPHGLTENTAPLFDRLGEIDRVNLDEGGQIEHEWREPVDSEWFDPWLAKLFTSGAAREIPTTSCQRIRAELDRFGFPTRGKHGKDFWYIRTSKAVLDDVTPIPPGRNPLAFIVSEDLHFHSPQEVSTASGKRRFRILTSGNGPIVRHLRRSYRIEVTCVQNYLQNV